MPPAYVKPYIKRQKNDAADAEAICEAVTRANMRFVETKTPEQQSCLMLHRTRGGREAKRFSQVQLLHECRRRSRPRSVTPRDMRALYAASCCVETELLEIGRVTNVAQWFDYAPYGSVIASSNTGQTVAARGYIGQFSARLANLMLSSWENWLARVGTPTRYQRPSSSCPVWPHNHQPPVSKNQSPGSRFSSAHSTVKCNEQIFGVEENREGSGSRVSFWGES